VVDRQRDAQTEYQSMHLLQQVEEPIRLGLVNKVAERLLRLEPILELGEHELVVPSQELRAPRR
jgi:hypothetical protein